MKSALDIAKIYDENFERIYKFFYYKFLSKDISEELTSETFLKFVERIKKDNVEIDNLKSYLLGIAHNVYITQLKMKYKEGIQYNPEAEQEFGSAIDETIEQVEESSTIEEIALPFIQKLPDKQKEIAMLRFIDKNSLEDICKKLNKDMNYVKTTQKRAIRSLKNIIACTPKPTN